MVTTRGPMTRALGSALRAAKPGPADKATSELARRYATLIDDAQPAARYIRHLDGLRAALDMLATLDPPAAADAEAHFAKLTEALSTHSVMSDLGPKLLAALTALAMTPAARDAVAGGQNGAPNAGKLDELRRRRAARAKRAG